MFIKSATKVMLAGAMAVASLSPTLAAKRHMLHRMAGACAQPTGRCIADCDQLKWCQVYICNGGQSTPIPFPRCFEPSGLCFAAHC
jgi:hypothetical protein